MPRLSAPRGPARWAHRGCGGRILDHWGGINTLTAVIAIVAVTLVLCGLSGGALVPNAMGLSKQYTGTYLWGFVTFATLAVAMLVMLRVMQIRWTRTWAEKGGGEGSGGG